MKNIFVGNLNFEATEQDIRSLFEGFGTVDRASIATDRDTGKSRGFAFVEMPNEAEGEKAIAGLQSRELDGRVLTINEARPKADRGGDRGRQARW